MTFKNIFKCSVHPSESINGMWKNKPPRRRDFFLPGTMTQQHKHSKPTVTEREKVSLKRFHFLLVMDRGCQG